MARRIKIRCKNIILNKPFVWPPYTILRDIYYAPFNAVQCHGHNKLWVYHFFTDISFQSLFLLRFRFKRKKVNVKLLMVCLCLKLKVNLYLSLCVTVISSSAFFIALVRHRFINFVSFHKSTSTYEKCYLLRNEWANWI